MKITVHFRETAEEMTQIPAFMVEAGAQTQPFADLVSAYQFAL